MGRDTAELRRRLFCEKLRKAGVRFAIISNPKHIFYLTDLSSNLNPYIAAGKGQRSTSFAAIGSEGECSVLLGRSESHIAQAEGDTPSSGPEVSFYKDYDLDVTMVAYADEVAAEMRKWLRKSVMVPGERPPRRVGVEDWHLADIYRETVARTFHESKLAGISQVIMELRKTKGKDELDNIKQAAKMLDFAYGVAKEAARAGRTELEVFGEMNRASFERFGVYGLVGGDIISGERTLEMAGYATKRKLERGDAMVMDIQAVHRNYWCDTARTFVVGRPSGAQKRVLETIIEVKEMAARMLIPGARTADIADAVNAFLEKSGHARLPHHAGHTVGLDDQERPWLIHGSTETVRENQAFVVEPGVYEKATGGMRVEDCYVLTRSGREKVSKFPLDF
jgi:Xaa-Pro aminopeptidase